MENKEYKIKFLLIIFVSIIYGLFSVGPQLLFLQRAGSDFQGIYGQFNGDALYYLARIQDVLDGYPSVNNPYLLEHKADVYPQSSLPEIIVAEVSKLTHLPPPSLQVWLDFIFPALLFFFTCLLFLKISFSSAWSVFLSVLLYFIVLGPLNKPIHPQISFFFLLSFLYLFYEFVNRENKIICALLLGINLGLLFNIYFFHWSFLIVFLACYFFFSLLQKRYGDLRYLPIIFLPAIIIGLPYFISFYKASLLPDYTETTIRVGLYLSHWVETFPRLLVAATWFAFFLIFSWKLKLFKDKNFAFFGGLTLANIIYPNQQVITGKILQLAVHWSWMPIFIFCLASCFMIQVLKKRQLSKNSVFFSIAIIAVFLFFPAIRLASFTVLGNINIFYNQEFLKYQKLSPIFQWLNNQTNKDDVVYSNAMISHLLPVYTHNNVLYDRYIFNFVASNKDVAERFLIANLLNPDVLNKQNFGFEYGSQLLWNFAAGSEYNTHRIHRFFGVPYDSKYSVEKESRLIQDVLEKIKKKDFFSLLKKYNVRYIVWDENTDSNWQINKFTWLKYVYRSDNISVWRIE